MTDHEFQTIAAFCARGREIGYVLMHRGRIIRYGVKTVKGKRSGKAFAKRIGQSLMSVIERLTPRCLVVVEDRGQQNRIGGVNDVLSTIASSESEFQLNHVRSIPLSDAKQYLCGDHTITHKALSESVISKHPILHGIRSDFVMYRPLYWELVLLAVALAETASRSP